VKPIKAPIFMELKNRHEACFIVDNPYWQGTIVTFSELSAKFFSDKEYRSLVTIPEVVFN
jgi:hypothetical protein